MLRSLCLFVVCLFSSQLLFAQEKNAKDNPDQKPNIKAEGVKKEAADALVKKNKGEPDGVKKANPDAPVKKDNPDAVKKPEAIKKVAKPDGEKPKDKGRVSKIGVEGSTLTLWVDGKEYSFEVNDSTRAMLKTKEQDGKSILLGFQLFNANSGEQQKEGVKKGDAAAEVKKKVVKPTDQEKPAKPKPENKPDGEKK